MTTKRKPSKKLTERDRFEKWASSMDYPTMGWSLSMEKVNGAYWNWTSHCAWLAWQAARRKSK